MNVVRPRVIRFGVFQADLRTAELFKNGRKIKLQEQPFQVLGMLLEKSGEIVTREELQRKLWPADTFVDFDHAINIAVKKIRDALGDSANTPRYIETLARRGYRFIYPVEWLPLDTPRPVPAPSPSWIARMWVSMAHQAAAPIEAEDKNPAPLVKAAHRFPAPAQNGPAIRPLLAQAERLLQIDRLLDAARGQEPEQRGAYLEQACAGDKDLRQEVEALLAAHEKAGNAVERPTLDLAAQAQTQKQDQPLVGRRVGPYEILSLLGRGGMGEVYRARDTRLDRIDALKILPPKVAGDPERLRRFVREAKAASALNHSNIATIYEIGESDGIHWIAMELVEGETLSERITVGADPCVRPLRGGHGGPPLPIETILDIGIQIADTLTEAHSKRITHRDIKPANLMLTPKGQVKVLDFGLAKITRVEGQAAAMATSADSQTFPGLMMGTAQYMSPEQVLGQPVDHRSDLFSLGVVLYEMATGQPPFRGETPASIFEAILHVTPTWPPRVQTTVPDELKRIINKSLEKFREARYQTASDLLADLKRLKRDTDSGKSAAYLAAAGRILPRWNAKRWIAVTALLAVLVVPLWWYLSRQKSEVIREPMRIVPFTTLPGIEANPRFSPDGKLVAFQWNGPARDNWDIYVKQVGPGEPLRLTSDPAWDGWPVWSPDGGEIAFVRVSGEVPSIYTVPSLGGAERKLYELRAPSDASSLSWSPDGRWLAFSEKSAAESPARIYLLSLDTRQKIPLTSPPAGPYGDFSPEFSPDGKRVGFVRRNDWAVYDVWVQPVSSGEAIRLTYENYSRISRPAWTADGREIVFTTRFAVFRVPLKGGMPQAVAGIGENAGDPAIWGNHMVFTQSSGMVDKIWRMRGPNSRGKDRSAAPFLGSTRPDWSPAYSPDGKKIAFNSLRSGSYETWICDSDGAKPVQLTNLRRFSGSPRWSPDGNRIAFDCRPEADSEIYVIDADGGIPQRLTNEKSQDQVPSWSRDGRWIYFSSNRGGSYQVWKMPSEGGKAVQVTKGGGFYAVEPFDGKILYYTKPGQRSYSSGPIWKVSRDGGEETPVLDREIHWGDWALSAEGIYFSTCSGKKYTIEFLSFQTGKVAPIYQEETSSIRSFLTISPDGQWFLYNEDTPWESDLMLVENFH